jgi:hypothetical protein
MRGSIALLAGLLGLFSLMTPSLGGHERYDPCCGVARSALLASMRMKPGMTRRQVERSFVLDGGAMTPAESRYAYRDCVFIRVDVSFKVKDESRRSPGDIVTRVSTPYLSLPTMD